MKTGPSTMLRTGVKAFGIKAASGGDATPEQIAQINSFALKELTAGEVYVRKFLLAHNGVDRDQERFTESLLDDFSNTIVGKSLIEVHDRQSLPIGLFFDASTEEMTPSAFKTLTGVDLLLPDGTKMVKVLWAWTYMLRDEQEEKIKSIDAGIIRYVSISFGAADLVGVRKETNGPYLYFEYIGPGEALEGSLVWLGAQPGAMATKAFNNKLQEGENMKEFLKKLSSALGKTFSEDSAETAVEQVKTLVAEKDAKIAELAPLAADGKAYREELVAGYVASRAKLGEVTEKTEDQESLKKVVSAYPIEFLKSESKILAQRVAEKFPTGSQLAGDPSRDKSAKANDNPLIPKD